MASIFDYNQLNNSGLGVDISATTPDFMNTLDQDLMNTDLVNSGSTGTSGGIFDGIDMQGISQGIGAVGALANTYFGFRNMQTARDQLSFQRQAWQEQFGIQKDEYNRRVSERAARIEANRAASQRVGG